MNKLINIIGGIGFVLFIVGAGGMDNESVVVPVIMMGVGVVMIFSFIRIDKEFYTEK